MSINNLGKQLKELEFLYDWLQIARKSKQNLKTDLKMIFDLISIPISQSELTLLCNVIDPQGKKNKLEKKDFIDCFVIEQDCKKPHQKDLIKAFKYVSGDKQTIQVQQLKSYFQSQNIESQTADVIIGQLEEYMDQNGKFDYKRFAGCIYQLN